MPESLLWLLSRDDFRLTMGLLIGGGLLWLLAQPPERRFDELGMAMGTSVYRASFDDYAVHTAEDHDDIDMMLRGWDERKFAPFALLLGNSQLHAINQRRLETDKNAPELLFESRSTLGLEVLTISIPNASLTELFVLAEYVLVRRLPRIVIVAACFDDTREDSLRPSVRELLADRATSDAVNRLDAGRGLAVSFVGENREKAEATRPNNPNAAGLEGTIQQEAEDYLDKALASWLPIWRERPTMRGRLEFGLYRWRNYLLGISPQSKRRRIPSRYNQHLEALDGLLQDCSRRRITCVVYIPPLRSDVAPPYVPEEYAGFKNDVEAICKKREGRFVNLEDLVPAEWWGQKESTREGGALELDFMHFQGPGHVLLADALKEVLGQLSENRD